DRVRPRKEACARGRDRGDQRRLPPEGRDRLARRLALHERQRRVLAVRRGRLAGRIRRQRGAKVTEGRMMFDLRPRSFVGLVAIIVGATLACGGGGGAKGAPLVADSPSNETLGSDTPSDGEDGGAPTAKSGDKPAGAPVLQGNEEGAQALLKQFVAP